MDVKAAMIVQVVHPGDDSVGVDQIGDPLGAELVKPVIGLPQHVIRFADLLVDVGQQRVRKPFGVRECLLVLGCVKGNPDDLRPDLLKLWGSSTEPPAFLRSPRCGRFHIPPQHEPGAGELVERDRVAVLIGH